MRYTAAAALTLIAQYPLDQLHVGLLRILGRHALDLGPRVKFGPAGEVGESRPFAGHIAFGGLLEMRIQPQLHVVAGVGFCLGDVFCRFFKQLFLIRHRVSPRKIVFFGPIWCANPWLRGLHGGSIPLK